MLIALDWIGGNPVLGFSKLLKGAGISITGVVLAFEVADTWDAINDNTNGERVWKSLIQVSWTLAIYYTVGASVAAAFAGTIFCVGVLAPIIIGVAIVVGIYLASEYAYNLLEIE